MMSSLCAASVHVGFIVLKRYGFGVIHQHSVATLTCSFACTLRILVTAFLILGTTSSSDRKEQTLNIYDK